MILKIPSCHFDTHITLYNLGNVHMGNSRFNQNLFDRVIEKISSDSNARWVSTGDLLEMALRESVSNIYTAKSPEVEYEEMIEALRPIGDKCLGILGSNHHARFEKATEMSLDKLISKETSIPYLENMSLI